ncbi:hypothetical protein [Pelomonas sp. Root1444]|uniref:hypothetical protein n=1 Tax=Pelomonas sp. Root1444 TaxID=1736464 RepID=UPI0012F786C2|nr:hypothetical protein [Pelomonas sp. Root1444]
MLADEDASDFWRFTARIVQTLHPPKRPSHTAPSDYDSLCSAVQNSERKVPVKGGINGIPRASRRLSTDELQKSVLRLKDKLFSTPAVWPFFNKAFCRWIQAKRLETLLAILDAFNCAHDEVGVLTAPMPEVSIEQVDYVINSLSKEFRSYDLMVVCAGLMLDHDSWHVLSSAFEALRLSAIKELQQALNQPSSAQPTAVQDQTSDSDLAPVKAAYPSAQRADDTATSAAAESHITSEWQNNQQQRIDKTIGSPAVDIQTIDLDGLHLDLNSLADDLAAATQRLRLGEIVNKESLLLAWSALDERLTNHAKSLGVDVCSFAALQDRLERAKAEARASQRLRELLQRLVGLEHASDPAFQPVRSIVETAQAQLGAIGRGDEISADLLTALSALATLVTNGESLDDEVAAEAGEVVRARFGSALTTAALRGKLQFKSVASGDVAPEDQLPLAPIIADQQPELSQSTGTLEKGRSEPIDRAAVVPAVEVVALPSHHNDKVVPDEGLSGVAVDAAVESAQDPFDAPTANSICEETAEQPESGLSSGAAPHGSTPGEPQENLQLSADAETSTRPSEGEDRASASLQVPVSFAEYARSHWIGSNGQVGIAPWSGKNFAAEQATKSLVNWRAGHFGLAYLRTAASHNQASTPLTLDELRAAHRLLVDPFDISSVLSSKRLARLRSDVETNAADRLCAVGVVLEALSPTLPCNLSSDDVKGLVRQAQFETPSLAAVVEFLLNGWAAAAEPLDLLRAHLAHQGNADPTVLASDLRDAQKQLRSTVATLWSAAGGRLQNTHCRRAWTEFIQRHVAPIRDLLAPSSEPPRESRRPVGLSQTVAA